MLIQLCGSQCGSRRHFLKRRIRRCCRSNIAFRYTKMKRCHAKTYIFSLSTSPTTTTGEVRIPWTEHVCTMDTIHPLTDMANCEAVRRELKLWLSCVNANQSPTQRNCVHFAFSYNASRSMSVRVWFREMHQGHAMTCCFNVAYIYVTCTFI